MDIGYEERLYWIETMSRIATPVLTSLSERKLVKSMPIEAKLPDRENYTYLEALGRLLCGMAPWLENATLDEKEEARRLAFADLARSSIDAATDPDSPDKMNFSQGMQPIVDAAFLSHAFIRAPRELWEKLEPRVQRNVVHCLKQTRTRKPTANNWLLFAAMIETALFLMGETDWDPMRIDYALKQHQQWYVGDSSYGDGPSYHWDYYNSFVIQPMMVDIIRTVGDQQEDWKLLTKQIVGRATRHAAVQERLISPEGTFPPIGRSLAYRFGALQLLAQMALQNSLSPELKPAQVRSALTAVIRRTIEMPGTFTDEGWLRIGFSGHQPEIGETYISTGSLYLCAAVFLPLGLSAEHPFWRGEAAWTAKKAWSGESFPIDKSYKD